MTTDEWIARLVVVLSLVLAVGFTVALVRARRRTADAKRELDIRRFIDSGRPPIPVVDMLRDINETMRLTVTATAEAIGKAVQTATFAPADPTPPKAPVEHAFDADIEAGVVDTSDPTDAAVWLQRERTPTAPLQNGDNPFGIPGLRAERS